MGKQGPCCHCGVTSTPLWRNGPPEKPVLCNACGSRWRTKGTLVNYTPLHARLDPDEYEEHRVARVKTISLKRKDEKLNKRKMNYDNAIDGEYTPDYSQGFRKSLDEDASNRSSSGSAISNSESCAQFGNTDASDLTAIHSLHWGPFTGPAQSMVWDGLVPSRKRTCVTRPKQSSVEKLTKDLHTILHEQASYFSGSSEEDLLFESEAPMGSVEFGHGSILIRHPNSMMREEESEASSISVDNKLWKVDEGYATPASVASLNDSKSVYNSSTSVEKVKKLNGIMDLESVKRDKFNHEKLQILWSHCSPLCQIDLTKIINSDVFWGRLTADEQQDLLNYLPSVDTSALPDGSLESMFASPYFVEDLSSFQQLFAEGVLDSSFLGFKTEDCKVLRKLAISEQIKCKWVEHFNIMKDKRAKESAEKYSNIPAAKSSSSVIIAKKSQDDQKHPCPEMKTTLKIPKRAVAKAGYECKELVQNEGSCFIPTPRNPFALQANGGSLMLDSFHLEDESSDQDLLLDVPSNGLFPEAELLRPSSSFASQQASASCSSIHPTLVHP